MTGELQIIEVTTIGPALLEELTDLLTAVVEDGASIGFLPPLSKDAAREYWENVLSPGVKLWIARLLMNTVESRAKLEGRSLLILDTRLGDPSNILYRSQGYVEAGSIPRYAKSANGDLHATVFFYKEI